MPQDVLNPVGEDDIAKEREVKPLKHPGGVERPQTVPTLGEPDLGSAIPPQQAVTGGGQPTMATTPTSIPQPTSTPEQRVMESLLYKSPEVLNPDTTVQLSGEDVSQAYDDPLDLVTQEQEDLVQQVSPEVRYQRAIRSQFTPVYQTDIDTKTNEIQKSIRESEERIKRQNEQVIQKNVFGLNPNNLSSNGVPKPALPADLAGRGISSELGKALEDRFNVGGDWTQNYGDAGRGIIALLFMGSDFIKNLLPQGVQDALTKYEQGGRNLIGLDEKKFQQYKQETLEFAAQNTQPTGKFDPDSGKWGDYGSGGIGAALYVLNALPSLVTGSVYNVADNIRSLYTGEDPYEGNRLLDAYTKGRDWSFSNQWTPEKYISLQEPESIRGKNVKTGNLYWDLPDIIADKVPFIDRKLAHWVLQGVPAALSEVLLDVPSDYLGGMAIRGVQNIGRVPPTTVQAVTQAVSEATEATSEAVAKKAAKVSTEVEVVANPVVTTTPSGVKVQTGTMTTNVTGRISRSELRSQLQQVPDPWENPPLSSVIPNVWKPDTIIDYKTLINRKVPKNPRDVAFERVLFGSEIDLSSTRRNPIELTELGKTLPDPWEYTKPLIPHNSMPLSRNVLNAVENAVPFEMATYGKALPPHPITNIAGSLSAAPTRYALPEGKTIEVLPVNSSYVETDPKIFGVDGNTKLDDLIKNQQNASARITLDLEKGKNSAIVLRNYDDLRKATAQVQVKKAKLLDEGRLYEVTKNQFPKWMRSADPELSQTGEIMLQSDFNIVNLGTQRQMKLAEVDELGKKIRTIDVQYQVIGDLGRQDIELSLRTKEWSGGDVPELNPDSPPPLLESADETSVVDPVLEDEPDLSNWGSTTYGLDDLGETVDDVEMGELDDGVPTFYPDEEEILDDENTFELDPYSDDAIDETDEVLDDTNTFDLDPYSDDVVDGTDEVLDDTNTFELEPYKDTPVDEIEEVPQKQEPRRLLKSDELAKLSDAEKKEYMTWMRNLTPDELGELMGITKKEPPVETKLPYAKKTPPQEIKRRRSLLNPMDMSKKFLFIEEGTERTLSRFRHFRTMDEWELFLDNLGFDERKKIIYNNEVKKRFIESGLVDIVDGDIIVNSKATGRVQGEPIGGATPTDELRDLQNETISTDDIRKDYRVPNAITDESQFRPFAVKEYEELMKSGEDALAKTKTGNVLELINNYEMSTPLLRTPEDNLLYDPDGLSGFPSYNATLLDILQGHYARMQRIFNNKLPKVVISLKAQTLEGVGGDVNWMDKRYIPFIRLSNEPHFYPENMNRILTVFSHEMGHLVEYTSNLFESLEVFLARKANFRFEKDRIRAIFHYNRYHAGYPNDYAGTVVRGAWEDREVVNTELTSVLMESLANPEDLKKAPREYQVLLAGIIERVRNEVPEVVHEFDYHKTIDLKKIKHITADEAYQKLRETGFSPINIKDKSPLGRSRLEQVENLAISEPTNLEKKRLAPRYLSKNHSKVLYHGTTLDPSVNLRNINPVEGGATAEFGLGVYLSSDKLVAINAATKLDTINKPPTLGVPRNSPNLRRVNTKNLPNIIDLNQKPIKEIKDIFAEAAFIATKDNGFSTTFFKNVKEVGLMWNKFKEGYFKHFGVPAPESVVRQFQQVVTRNFLNMGIDGGAYIKNGVETVVIYNNKSLLEKIDDVATFDIPELLAEKMQYVNRLKSQVQLDSFTLEQLGDDVSVANYLQSSRELAEAFLTNTAREVAEIEAQMIDELGTALKAEYDLQNGVTDELIEGMQRTESTIKQRAENVYSTNPERASKSPCPPIPNEIPRGL